jgi:hypothetical protein
VDNQPTDENYLKDWLARTCELVDKYQPAVVWFDWWIEQPVFVPYLQKFAAYYYNRGAEWKKGVAINYKNQAFPEKVAVYDIERGKLDKLRPYLWQTDTSVGLKSWGYIEGEEFRTPDSLVDDLIDIVSKNGLLLLNIGPSPDGTIPDEAQKLLLDMGKWLASNGEAGEALGSYPGIRLWPDVIPSLCGASPRLSPVAHYSDKRRLGPSADLAFCAGPVPLRRLYVLDVAEGDEAAVDRMDPREATLELVTSTYRLGDESAGDLEREFSILTRLVSRRLVRRLRVPQDLGRLAEARDAVLADLSD